MGIPSRKPLLFIAVVTLLATFGVATVATRPHDVSAQPKSESDWKPVEEALGKSGQVQAGDVFRVAMPRTDLAVKVHGVDVKAGFALGSYAAFKKMGSGAMVMGDLVLLDEEVQNV